MIWVKWTSLEAFNSWHEEVKAQLGLPKMSVKANGEIDPTAVISTDYVLPTIVAENDIRAFIGEQYAAGLEVSFDPNDKGIASEAKTI